MAEASEIDPSVLNDTLPDAADVTGILRFAMTCDACRHFGSFAAAATAARDTKRQTLTELRTELFMSARASHHVGDLAYVERYKVLLPLFLQFRSDHSVGGITPEQQREVRMIDHLGFPVRDLARSKAFFTAALAPLGIGVVMEVTAEQTGGSPK